ncbi:hypothetical protein ACFY9R_31815 [Streptomyces albidoflavus]|uniref:hypothetical protein n=1 Tax=Streptomyces albidoflavus TaxID=1886 RepID=UPI003410D3FE
MSVLVILIILVTGHSVAAVAILMRRHPEWQAPIMGGLTAAALLVAVLTGVR